MIPSQSIVAKKYAIAFLNVFGTEIDLNEINKIMYLAQFLTENKDILFFLSLSYFDFNYKNKVVNFIFEKFLINEKLKQLLFLLISNNKIYLFNDILKDIAWLYKERANLIDLTIYSSAILTSAQIGKIVFFAERISGKKALYNCLLDKNLIAGIRVVAPTFLWEFSIKNLIKKLVIKINSKGRYGY